LDVQLRFYIVNITQKDIAAKLGVSNQLVSYALNGTGTVSDQMRQRIVATAAELGYRPNTSARVMKTGRFGCVGILMSTIRNRSSVQSLLMEGIHDELALHDQHLMLVKSPDEPLTDEAAMPRLLREWMVDGLLVAFNLSTPPGMIETIRRHNIPSIWLNSDQEIDCVRPNDEAASYDAARHLQELGHRRIAYVTHWQSTHYSVAHRERGYRRAMREAGLKAQILKLNVEESRARQLEASLRWLDSPERPTAMTFYSTEMASIAFYAAERLSLRIPQDISLIGCGEVPVYCPCTALDTMMVPFSEVGKVAVRQLLHKIEHPDENLPLQQVPFWFVRGETSAPPPAV
jgi:LacI family transcriptional regulator